METHGGLEQVGVVRVSSTYLTEKEKKESYC